MRKITLLLATVSMALTGYAQENRAVFTFVHYPNIYIQYVA